MTIEKGFPLSGIYQSVKWALGKSPDVFLVSTKKIQSMEKNDISNYNNYNYYGNSSGISVSLSTKEISRDYEQKRHRKLFSLSVYQKIRDGGI